MKTLVPTDGSETSLRAVDHVINKSQSDSLELHLINVQPPLPYGARASSVVGHGSVEDYHRQEGLKCLEPAQRKLDAAGIKYHSHVAIGEPGEVIASYAQEHAIDQVVMGTHGRGAVASALLGSVAKEVLEKASVPVVLVK
jgi:nucleotide-binding universal stress UspA family protein